MLMWIGSVLITRDMWRYNSDGIDLINSRNVLIKNCFTRDFDDCIVIKGIMGYDTLSNENIIVDNCVIWCDWGRALEIGAETCAPEYRNIVFHDCDVIHGAHINLDIQHHNHAQIHDVLVSDIRVEYSKYQMEPVYQHDMTVPYPNPQPSRLPCPMGVYINNSGLYNTADYRNGSVRDIAFRKISVITEKGINATSQERPGIVDRSRTAITDPLAVYSGCYIRALINFYPFNPNGNRGIACGLQGIQFWHDGEPLNGRIRAEDAFDELDDEDDDDFLD